MTFVLHLCYILGWFEWCLSGGMLHWRRMRGVLVVFEGCLRDFCVSGGRNAAYVEIRDVGVVFRCVILVLPLNA